MTASTQASLPPGTVIGGYRIEREVGRGAMAVVYRAIQLNLERPVALKILTGELARNEEFVVRFFNEARAAASLSHAHIIQAYDAGVAEGSIHFFAMEFVEGETLLQRIERQGFIRPGPGLGVALDIADALNHGWQRQSLTHGDIKPENIMINTAGETKLADFGLAKVADHDFEGSEIMLTPLYAAPEMIRGTAQKGDCRGDIYSFGATLYHMFGGSPPYPGTQAQEVMARHLNEELEPLKSRNPAIPAPICDLVSELLQKNPDLRPQEWIRVLEKLQAVRDRLNAKTSIRPAIALSPERAALARRAAIASSTQKTAAARRPGRRSWQVWGMCLLLGSVIALGVLALLPGVRARLFAAKTPAGGSLSPGAASPTDLQAGASPTAWESVKTAVEASSDPQQALELLDAFRDTVGPAVPSEFAALHEHYRDAAAWRLAAEREAERARRGGVPIEPAGSALEEPLDAPEREGDVPFSGVPDRVSPDGPAAGPAEPLGKGALADNPALLLDPAIPLPSTPDDQRLDAYMRYLHELSQLVYLAGTSVEPQVRAGLQWLARHDEPSPEKERMDFLVRTVLPALDESVPRLVAARERLLGEKMPGKAYTACVIRDITLSGIQVDETTRHGRMTRTIPWSALNDPGYLIYLSREVANDAAAGFEPRRSLLALLLVSRYEKPWQQSLESLPDIPEKRLWETLRSDLEQAGREGDALDLWQAVRDACSSGNRIDAYRRIRQLQQTRSATAYRYRAVLERVADVAGAAVPEHQAGVLLRRAQQLLAAAPEEALLLANFVRARYGNAEFPEKDALGAVQGGALERLQAPEWVLNLARQNPLHAASPFGAAHPVSPPWQALLVLQEIQLSGQSLPQVQEHLPLLRGLALVAVGDWAAAAEALRERLPLEQGVGRGVPLSFLACAVYARGLLEDRFSPAAPQAEQVLADLALLTGGDVRGGRGDVVAPLFAEYALATRQVLLPPEQVLRWQDVGASRDWRSRMRVQLGAISYLLETGHGAEAAARIDEMLTPGPGAGDPWLEEPDRRLLQQAANLVNGRDAEQAGGFSPADLGRLPEWGLRVLLSAALYRAVPTGDWLAAAAACVERTGGAWGPLGGSTAYDLVLARAAVALGSGDLQQAVAAVDWGLGLTHPALYPYYGRLLLLRAGLYALVSPVAGGTEIAEQMRVSPMVSRLEETVLKGALRDTDATRARIRARSQSRFWFAWIYGAMRLREQAGNEREKVLSWYTSEPLMLAENCLISGLERFAAVHWQVAAGTRATVPVGGHTDPGAALPR